VSGDHRFRSATHITSLVGQIVTDDPPHRAGHQPID
jgi:hypothetical protein